MKKYTLLVFLFSFISFVYAQDYIFPRNDSSFTNKSAYIEEYSFELTDNNGRIVESNKKLSQKMVIDWENGIFQNISYNELEHPYFYEKTSFNKEYLITSRKYINYNNYTTNETTYNLTESSDKAIQFSDRNGTVLETYELTEEYGQSIIYYSADNYSYKRVYESTIDSLLSPNISKLNYTEYSYEENELSSITEKTWNNNISISNVFTGKYNWEFINYFDDDNRCTKSEDEYFTFVYKYVLDENQNWIQKDTFTVENKLGHEILVPSSRSIRIIKYGNTQNLEIPETFYPYEEETPEISNIENTSQLYSIPLWEIRYYVDSFGDPTDKAYLCFYLLQEGTFSNSATRICFHC